MAYNYILMNKNTALVELEISPAGYIIAAGKLLNAEALPVSMLGKGQAALADSLNAWWRRRAIPASRDGLKFVLQAYGIETSTALAVKSLGLSLSDQYWVKPVANSVDWEDVNFFTNSFSTELGEAFFTKGYSKAAINALTPDASSNGWLKKKWVLIGGERYLAKAGAAPFFQQPYNEVAASHLLDNLNFSHVPYTLIEEQGRPLSLCQNFVTADTELVPADLVRNIAPKANNESEYTHFLRCAEALHIPGVEKYLAEFLTLDFLIENTDRHFGNFGFLRDVQSLEFLGPAPIFDNGTSLWCEAPKSEVGTWQKCMPFKASQKDQIKLVKKLALTAESLQKCGEAVAQVLNQNVELDEARSEKIVVAVENRARLLENKL